MLATVASDRPPSLGLVAAQTETLHWGGVRATPFLFFAAALHLRQHALHAVEESLQSPPAISASKRMPAEMYALF